MRILVIDPGERAGWCTATIDREDGELHVQDHGILALKPMALRAYKDIVVNRTVDRVIVETYKISGDPQKLASHRGSDVPTLQLYGMIRGYCWLNPGVTFEPQPPRAMNDALLSLNSGAPGATEMRERLDRITGSHDNTHDKSALLHLWQFYFRTFV